MNTPFLCLLFINQLAYIFAKTEIVKFFPMCYDGYNQVSQAFPITELTEHQNQ